MVSWNMKQCRFVNPQKLWTLTFNSAFDTRCHTHQGELTGMCGVLPSHEGGSGRCAESRHVVAVQNDAIVGQCVDIWCWNLCRAVKSYVIPSLNR
jgi:hypothetical protein